MQYDYAQSIDNTSLRPKQGIKQHLGTGRAKCHYLELTIRHRNDLSTLLLSAIKHIRSTARNNLLFTAPG